MVVICFYRANIVALILNDYLSFQNCISMKIQSILQCFQNQAYLFLILWLVAPIEHKGYFVDIDWSKLGLIVLHLLGWCLGAFFWSYFGWKHGHVFSEVGVFLEDGNIGRTVNKLLNVKTKEFLIFFQFFGNLFLTLDGSFGEMQNLFCKLKPLTIRLD